MNLPQSTPWYPRIIVQRWRSMLGVLTLLGLFAGLSVHFYPDLTANTATGQILLRSIPQPGHRTSIQNPTGIAAATFRSDAVLAQTMIELNLPEEWRMEGEVCVARLEDRICSKPDRIAGRVTLSVKGHNRSEAIRIWNKLIEVAGDEFIRLENPVQAATLNSLETEVQGLQTRVTSTHRALSMAMETEEYSRRHRKVHSPDTLPSLPDTLPNFPPPRSSARDVQTAMAEHQQAVAALEAAQGKLAEQTKIGSSMERPFIVRVAPSISPPRPLGASLLSLIKYSTIGLGAGILLAVVLAYLLELFFPRKADTFYQAIP